MKKIFRGDIFTADLSSVIGSEQEGKRPVLIIQNDLGNRYSPTTIVAPMTSKHKKNLPTHVSVVSEFLPKNSIILLEQIQTIDKGRLTEYLGRVDARMMKQVDKAILISLGISNNNKRRIASSPRKSRRW